MGRYIFGISGIIVAGMIFFLYTMPAYNGVQDMQSQIDQYNAALDKATQLQQLKQTLLNKYNSFNPSDINRLQTMIPDHVDNIGLILDLDSLATQHGMPLENVEVSSTGGSSSQTSGSAIGSATNTKYNSLVIKFTTHGTYQSFQQFMDDLESSLRIVDLVALSIKPDTTKGAQIGSYQYNISLKTYWLK